MRIKICGLTTAESIYAAAEAGADCMGLVFYPPSPRHLNLEAARMLLDQTGRPLPVVAVMVSPEEAFLQDVLAEIKPQEIQLHGEIPRQRLSRLRDQRPVKIIQALGIAHKKDLEKAEHSAPLVDSILLDAQAPPGALPGGNRLSFDWEILDGWQAPCPWLLSGGLDPHNVAEAIRKTRAPGVDVSSGVESAPGRKDPDLIHAFVRAARTS